MTLASQRLRGPLVALISLTAGAAVRLHRDRVAVTLLSLGDTLHLAGEGWLSDTQPLRRASEVVLFGDGDEIAQLAKLQYAPK